jgi:hypothetical protein
MFNHDGPLEESLKAWVPIEGLPNEMQKIVRKIGNPRIKL